MNQLNVYEYIPFESYTWGNVLVAAKNKEDADQVLKSQYKGIPVEFLSVVSNLFYNGEPCVVIDTTGEA